MGDVTLHTPLTPVAGSILLPGSKSISNRVLMIKTLSGLDVSLHHVSNSDDTLHLIKALQALEDPSATVIDIGHAGTDMRFLTAFLATHPGTYELTGSYRMQQRPIKELVDVLKSFGAAISYKEKEGYPPLIISGKTLKGGSASIKGNVSSQFISALLLIAPYFEDGLELSIEGQIVSKPYIDMTIGMMREFGADVLVNNRQFTVNPKPYSYSAPEYITESDWSAASYFYSLVALSPLHTSLTLEGLFNESFQADAVCATLFRSFGVETVYANRGITITKNKLLVPEVVEYDFVNCPDIAQTLACTCAGLKVPFHFTGLQTLNVKETNRIVALKTELHTLGVELETTEDAIRYRADSVSGDPDLPYSISTYNDHRMAMSFAPLCLVFKHLQIEQAEVVSKSYPGFWGALAQIGVVMEYKL